METTSESSQSEQRPLLIIDETLKDRFGLSPLFPEQIAKANRIMTVVRQKQTMQPKKQ